MTRTRTVNALWAFLFLVLASILFGPTAVHAVGPGKVRSIAGQLLEDLGVTSGGVFSGGTGDLLADGTVPLSADWASPFDITVVDLNATNLVAPVLTDGVAASDVPTTDLVVTGQDPFPQGVNLTGGNLILAGGVGARTFTITDFSVLTGDTLTYDINQAGVVTVTEGVEWSAGASNNASATNLATHLDTVSGIGAVAVAAVVHVTPDQPGTYSIAITEASDGMSRTQSDSGLPTIPSPKGAEVVTSLQIGSQSAGMTGLGSSQPGTVQVFGSNLVSMQIQSTQVRINNGGSTAFVVATNVDVFNRDLLLNAGDVGEVGTASFNAVPDTYLAAAVGGTLTLGTTDGGTEGTFSTSRFLAGADVVASVGYQSVATAIVATSDGLTTGLIPTNTSVCTVTVATDADDIATLPAPVIGMQIRIYVGGTGHEVRTVAASNVTINNVDSDGTNELALTADTYVTFECVSGTAWIARGFNNLGADLAALVPDAA